MPIKFTNNATTTLLAGVTDAETVLNVQAGKGDLFPIVSGDDFFFVTCVRKADGAFEIMKCVSRASGSDSLTVVRGQDNTSALALAAGDRCELRMNAAAFAEFLPVGTYYNKDEIDAALFTVARTDEANAFTAGQVLQKAGYGWSVSNDLGTVLGKIRSSGDESLFIVEGSAPAGMRLTDTYGYTYTKMSGGVTTLLGDNVERLRTTSSGVQLIQANTVVDMRAGRLEYTLSDLPNLSAMGTVEWVTCKDGVSGSFCRAIRHAGVGDFTYGGYTQNYPVIGVVLLTTAITGGQEIPVLTRGYVRSDGWSWNEGVPVYQGSSGVLTQTQPSASGNYVQQIGVAVKPNILRIDPDKTVIEVA